MAEQVQLTTDDKITQVANEIGRLQARQVYLSQQIPYHQNLSRAATSSGNYAEGKRISDLVDSMDAERQSNAIKLKALNESLLQLQSQKAAEVAAQAARVKEIESAAKLVEAQSKLSPDQLAAISLEKIKQTAILDKQKAEIAAKSDSEKTAEERKVKNYIILGVVVVVVISLAAVAYKMFSSKAAA